MRGDFDVPGYAIEGLLGAGASGQSWLARNESTGEQVVLRRVPLRDLEAGERAEGLVQTLGTLPPDNLVRVREIADSPPDELILVVDYPAGGTLEDLLQSRGGHLDPGEVVTVVVAIGRLLAAAHRAGVTHGNIAPGTIAFGADGRPVLLDLGLVDLVEGGLEAVATDGGSDGAGHGYVDPVTLRGGEPTPAGDVYGLAAVAYTALTGIVPAGPDEARRPLQQVAPGVPPPTAHAVQAGLGQDPRARPGAEEFAELVGGSCPSVPVRLPDDPGGGAAVGGVQAGGPQAGGRQAQSGPARPVGPDGGAPAIGGSDGVGGSGVDPFVAASGPAMGSGVGPGIGSDTGAGATAPAPPGDGDEGDDGDGDDGEGDEGRGGLRRSPWIALAMVAAVVVVVGATLGVSRWVAEPDPEPRPTPTASPSSASPTRKPAAVVCRTTPTGDTPSWTPTDPPSKKWYGVLDRLFRHRSEAFRDGQAEQLNKVYVKGSQLRQEDVELLNGLHQKGYACAVGLRTAVLDLDVVSVHARRVVLEITGQLQPYVLVSSRGDTVQAPGHQPRAQRVTLRRVAGQGWLIAGTSPSATSSTTPTGR